MASSPGPNAAGQLISSGPGLVCDNTVACHSVFVQTGNLQSAIFVFTLRWQHLRATERGLLKFHGLRRLFRLAVSAPIENSLDSPALRQLQHGVADVLG